MTFEKLEDIKKSRHFLEVWHTILHSFTRINTLDCGFES